jgi:hypothetical protein
VFSGLVGGAIPPTTQLQEAAYLADRVHAVEQEWERLAAQFALSEEQRIVLEHELAATRHELAATQRELQRLNHTLMAHVTAAASSVPCRSLSAVTLTASGQLREYAAWLRGRARQRRGAYYHQALGATLCSRI